MSGAENDRFGAALERFAAEEWPLVRTSHSGDVADWFDAVVSEPIVDEVSGAVLLPEGRPVECKAARVSISSGDRTRRGRFWIHEEAHRRLLDASGAYLMGVYEASSGGTLRRSGFFGASTVDEVIHSWIDCSNGRRDGRYAQIAWPNLFTHLDGFDVDLRPYLDDPDEGATPPKWVIDGLPFDVDQVATDGGER